MLGDISNRKRYEFILSCIGEMPGYLSDTVNVLDVGCGSGDIELFLGERGISNITAIDINPNLIVLAKQRNKRYKHIFFETSAEDFVESAENRKWDCIICTEVLEHVRQPEELITNIRRLLKDNGILIISIPNGYGPWELYHRISERNNYRLVTDQLPGKHHLHRFNFNKVVSLFCANGFTMHKFKKSNFVSHVWPFSILGYHSINTFEMIDCHVADYLPKSLASGWYFCFVSK